MKTNILIKSLLFFVTLIIYSCGNVKNEKPQLTYENGNQKVEIKILDGNNYLEYDKPTKTDFVLTNIEPNTFIVAGAGIKVLGTKNGIMKTEIKVPNDYLETDTLNVKVRFGKNPEETHEFYIPMKKAE